MTTATPEQVKAMTEAIALIEESKSEAQALVGMTGSLWVCCFESDKTPFRQSKHDGRISIGGGPIWARRAGDVRKMAEALDAKAVEVGTGARVIAMPVSEWAPARVAQLDEIIANMQSYLPK